MDDLERKIEQYVQGLVASMDIREVRQTLYEMMCENFKRADRASIMELMNLVYTNGDSSQAVHSDDTGS